MSSNVKKLAYKFTVLTKINKRHYKVSLVFFYIFLATSLNNVLVIKVLTKNICTYNFTVKYYLFE